MLEYLKKYRFYFLVPFCLLVLMTLLLILLSAGTEQGAFIYLVR